VETYSPSRGRAIELSSEKWSVVDAWPAACDRTMHATGRTLIHSQEPHVLFPSGPTQQLVAEARAARARKGFAMFVGRIPKGLIAD